MTSMQLFLDVDGVLLNFERAFVSWLNTAYDMDLPPDYETPTWDFTEVLEMDVLRERWHAFLESSHAAGMPALVEPERFNDLSAAHRVHLLTNFPEPHMDKRRENLRIAGLRYESLHYGGLHAFNGHRPRSKADWVNHLREPHRPALFIDDHPDNCRDVSENCPGVEVWLMSRRFNQDFHHPSIRRAQDWDCVHERLRTPV